MRPTTTIGLDLGRHQARCSLADAEGARIVPLSGTRSGMVLRWADGDHPLERVTERVMRLAGTDQNDAIATMADVALAAFPELQDGVSLAVVPYIAVPVAFGPSCRAAVVDGFNRAGVAVTGDHLVDRPVAALCGWLASSSASGAPLADGLVVLIDNDGGQLSVVIADLDRRRLLASAPLSSGPGDSFELVTDRLKELLWSTVPASTRGRTASNEPMVIDRGTADSFANHVVLTGANASHSALRQLVESVLPRAIIRTTTSVVDATDTDGSIGTADVALGLLELDRLDDWTAAWPTADVLLNGSCVRPAGSRDHGDIALLAPRRAELSLAAADGTVLALTTGSISSTAVQLPPEIGLVPRLRILGDGRMLVLGPEGVRPLSLHIDWPARTKRASGGFQPANLNPLGRRPIELLSPMPAATPRAGRRHQATTAS